MRCLPLILFFIIESLAFSQNLDCSEFENGVFTAKIEGPIDLTWKVIRNGNSQVEIFSEEDKNSPNKQFQDKQYGLIDWVDECSYIYTYDGSKFELNETQKIINEIGGILVIYGERKLNCLTFTSYIYHDEQEVIVNGTLCIN